MSAHLEHGIDGKGISVFGVDVFDCACLGLVGKVIFECIIYYVRYRFILYNALGIINKRDFVAKGKRAVAKDRLSLFDRCFIDKFDSLAGGVCLVLIDGEHNIDIQASLTGIKIHTWLGSSYPCTVVRVEYVLNFIKVSDITKPSVHLPEQNDINRITFYML